MDHLYLNRANVRALNARRIGREKRRVCHIPEKGLYFGLRGQIFSCCYNKSYVLGTYPEHSIREIWEGKALKQQRRAIKKWDMALGCQGCYELIKSQNFNALPLKNYDRFAPRRGPVSCENGLRVVQYLQLGMHHVSRRIFIYDS